MEHGGAELWADRKGAPEEHVFLRSIQFLRKEKAPQPQQLPPADPKTLKQIRKAEKAEREFRKKFKV